VLPAITLSTRLSYARNSVLGTVIGETLREHPELITLDLRIARALELGRVAIDVGFTAGAGRWHGRDFVGINTLPTVHLDVTVGASVPLWGRSYLAAELAEQTYVMTHSAGASPFSLITLHLIGGIWL
jgi:hypothetical protein